MIHFRRSARSTSVREIYAERKRVFGALPRRAEVTVETRRLAGPSLADDAERLGRVDRPGRIRSSRV